MTLYQYWKISKGERVQDLRVAKITFESSYSDLRRSVGSKIVMICIGTR